MLVFIEPSQVSIIEITRAYHLYINDLIWIQLAECMAGVLNVICQEYFRF